MRASQGSTNMSDNRATRSITLPSLYYTRSLVLRTPFSEFGLSEYFIHGCLTSKLSTKLELTKTYGKIPENGVCGTTDLAILNPILEAYIHTHPRPCPETRSLLPFCR